MREYLLKCILIIWTGCVAGFVAADEIYKCVDANGKTRFSERPCGDNAQKIELKQSAAGVNYSGDQRQWDNIKYANKAREVNRELAKHEQNLSNLKAEKAQTISDLRYQQQFAAKNIAGQRYEKSLEKEIKRVTKDYDRRIKLEQKTIADLKADLEANWK